MDEVFFQGKKYPIVKRSYLSMDNPLENIILRHLCIRNSKIKTIDEIDGIYDANIESLDLLYNEISSLNGIEKLHSLERLSVGNNITEINNLESSTALTILHLYGRFSKIQNLNLPNLRILILKGNLQKIEKLDNLRNLQSLSLSYNKIQKIENLSHLTRLSTLNLAYNRISKIENLDRLDLIELDLKGNNISEIENLDSLANLGSLDLSSNNISEIKGLDNLKKLWSLDLSYNKITEIKGLSKLSNIQEVLLMENQINHITGIETIKFNTKLALDRNPIPKDQLDCFRYHYEIHAHESGNEMGDILFQVMETNRAKELLSLLISYWDELENVDVDSPEDNEPYLRLERERLATRSEIWEIKTKQLPEYAQVPAESALKYSTLSSEGMKMIKDLDKIQVETLDQEILKIFILQAKILLKRSSFYKFNRNNQQELAKMEPFFTHWDEKLGEFIANFQQ